MNHNVNCPYCGTTLLNSPELSGKVSECPRCGAPFQMPVLPKAKFAPPPPPQQGSHYPNQQQLQNNPYQGPLHTSHVSAPQRISGNNVLGIMSLCFAAMGLLTCGFTCIPGLVMAILGLRTQPNTTAVLGVVFNGIIAIPMILLFVLGGIGAVFG